MGKARTNARGHTQQQELRHENQQLKREIASLRKQLARIDLDRYSTVKDIIEEHYQLDKEKEGKEILEKMKKQWECHECGKGHLEIFIYNRTDTTFYYRICSNAPDCTNRTPSKPYTPQVKGIIRNK